jgi:hypothetical protein
MPDGVFDFLKEQDIPERKLLQRGSDFHLSTYKSAKKCSTRKPALKRSAKVK